MVQLGKSGAGTDAKESCKYFDELNELFGRRPINNKKGIDSLSSAGKRSSTADDDREIARKRRTIPNNCSTGSKEAVLDGVYPKGSSTSSEPILLKNLTVKPAVRSPGNANKGLHEVMDTFCSRMSKDQERSMEKYGEQLAASDENFMTRFQTTITESVQALLMGMREMHSAHIQPAPPPMAHHYTGFQPPIGPSYGNYSTPGNMAPPQQFMHYATPDNSTRPRAPSNSSPTKEGYQSSKNGKE